MFVNVGSMSATGTSLFINCLIKSRPRLRIVNLSNLTARRFLSSPRSTNAVKLAYNLFSPKDQMATNLLPLIVLHGLFGSKKNWESIAKALTKAGRKVITVDLRNHGESPHHDEMDYRLMSDDVELLVVDLKIPKSIILGHSMGGKVAMTLALNKSHLVDKVIVEDISPSHHTTRSLQTSGFPEYIAAMRGVKFDPSVKSAAEGRKAAAKQLHNTFPTKELRDFMLTNIDFRDGRCLWRINLDGIDDNLHHLVDFPVFETRYNGDALFIGGQNSPFLSEPYYPEIRRLFPKAEIRHIEGAGHWTHSDKPREFIAAVIDFLNRKQLH